MKILNRFTDEVIFEAETLSMKVLVLEAIKNGANLSGADLRGANLEGTNLYGAYLEGAYLEGAINIHSFQCGEYNRICYAVKHEKEVMFQIGCFWGDEDEAIKKIRIKYGKNSSYEKLVKIYSEMLKNQSC